MPDITQAGCCGNSHFWGIFSRLDHLNCAGRCRFVRLTRPNNTFTTMKPKLMPIDFSLTSRRRWQWAALSSQAQMCRSLTVWPRCRPQWCLIIRCS